MSETRKVTKSAMEKKRRTRINNSLTELKTIFGGMILNKTEKFDKMEKADILEMTVKYVKHLQKLTETDTANSDIHSCVTDDDHYSDGIHSCINEVLKFITVKDDTFDADMKTKLLDHLACMLRGGEAKITNTDKATDADTLIRKQCCYGCVQDASEICKHDSNNKNNCKGFRSNVNKNAINNVLINCRTCVFTPPGTAQFQSHSPNNPPAKISPELGAYRQAGTNELSVSMPAVPLTILVPSNVYSSLGTPCVIPFNIQTCSPQMGNIVYKNNIHSPINYQHLKAVSQICIPLVETNHINSSTAASMSSTSTPQADICSATLNTNFNRTVFSATSTSDPSNQTILTASVATATSTNLRTLPLERSNSGILCTSAREFSSSGRNNASTINDDEGSHQWHEAIEIRQSSGYVWRPW